MYTFLDKSGRKLCLRPEFTSSIVRAVLNNRASDSVNRVYYVRFFKKPFTSMEVPIDMRILSTADIENSINSEAKSFGAIRIAMIQRSSLSVTPFCAVWIFSLKANFYSIL